MTGVPFVYLLLSYSLGITVAVYAVLSLFISAFSALALYRMILDKSRSLNESDDIGRSLKR